MLSEAQVTLISPSGAAIKPMVESALRSELRMIELGLKQTMLHLQEYETQYEMTSDEFYRALTHDELQEALYTIDWAGEYKTWQKLQAKRQALMEIDFAN